MKTKGYTGLICTLLGGLGLLMLTADLTAASDGTDSGRQIPVTLSTGEEYVIKDLNAGTTPAFHVIDNPNALIVNSQKPGEMALVGEAAGKWKIDVETASGEKVSYKVEVAETNGADRYPRAASNAALATAAVNFGGAADKPAASVALDAGSGPVAPATAAPANDVAAALGGPMAGATASLSVPAAPAHMILADASSSAASTSGAPMLRPVNAASTTTMAPVAVRATLADASDSVSPVTSHPEVVSGSATIGSAVLMPSQSSQLPPEKFKDNPAGPTPTDSINGGTHYLPEDVVELAAGSSAIYDFPRRIRRISIADTAVADLQVVNPFQINLVGHKEGFTTLAVWDIRGQYQERQVRVDPFGRQQVMLNVIVSELNRGRMEAQGINWSLALSKYNVSILGLGGNLSTITPGAVLPAAGSIIPLLMSTNVNYALAAQGQGVSAQAFFEFLEVHNFAKILAEPHLLANSGEKAEFLSGGEIPIVLAQALNTSIVFKQYGTSVVFVPTVIGRDDIGLEVKPEVSEPDFTLGVSLFGFTVPAFVTRRAQTFVRLKNNQTLIIAGLLLRTKTSSVQKTPYLGDIPYLGNLFKSTTYKDQESDLVMTVTPQIVSPIPSDALATLPTEHHPLTEEDIRTRRLEQEDASRPRF